MPRRAVGFADLALIDVLVQVRQAGFVDPLDGGPDQPQRVQGVNHSYSQKPRVHPGLRLPSVAIVVMNEPV